MNISNRSCAGCCEWLLDLLLLIRSVFFNTQCSGVSCKHTVILLYFTCNVIWSTTNGPSECLIYPKNQYSSSGRAPVPAYGWRSPVYEWYMNRALLSSCHLNRD